MSRGRHRKPSLHHGRRAAAAIIATAPITIAVANPAAAATPPDSVLEIIAQCESGNRNVNNSTFPTSSASGFLQIIDGTWRQFGGREFASRAINATRAQQFIVGARIAAANPSLSDWDPSRPCWGPKVARHTTGTEAPRHAELTPTPARHSVTVVRGDTLSGIALREHVTVADLFARNRQVIGANANLIRPGQVFAF
jgi:LysM repeat protein